MATRTYQNEKGNPGPRLLRLRFVWLLFIYSLHAGAIWRSLTAWAVIIPRLRLSRLATCTGEFSLWPIDLWTGDESWKKEVAYVQQCTPQGTHRERGDCISILESP